MPPTSKKSSVVPQKQPCITAEKHKQFRDSVRQIRRQRSPRFIKARKAYIRGKQVFKGVHGIVERSFGTLSKLIGAARAAGCRSSSGLVTNRSRTRTSRGCRIGRDLCSMAVSPRMMPTTKGKAKCHEWSLAVATALRLWGIYLIDGEMPVSKGYIATGIDLLGVMRHPKQKGKWQLICIELKTGYEGVWESATLEPTDTGVKRSILNYALTQAQLTHECARNTLKEFDFAPPLVVLVNQSQGVRKWSPTKAVIKGCAHVFQ